MRVDAVIERFFRLGSMHGTRDSSSMAWEEIFVFVEEEVRCWGISSALASQGSVDQAKQILIGALVRRWPGFS